MQKKVYLLKKLLCMLLTAVLALGIMPQALGTRTVKALDNGSSIQAAGDDNEQHHASDIFALEAQEPAQLDAYPEDVYGAGKNQPFLLSEQNELALIVTDPANSNRAVTVYDTFDFSMKSRINNESYMYGPSSLNAINASSSIASGPYKGMQCIQSIGFDRDGTGKKQYIASVGILNNKLRLVVQHASTGTVYEQMDVEDLTEVNNAPLWVRDNYLAITAGDYDQDGRESVIIFVCGNSSVTTENGGYI